ncbi:right-handed parallel beta-helix repeat-containing protein [Parapedobacter tibetensis]|uniref:right-handed parallel beta-helix repeat-containing protein n=1 Tax=Parapedobacter tibetensis TaxID=2972951 RepID=UPI00214DB965|nr:right-handed parallel beta-helix repeat-containing protein [Parapedobacter tibetensis]
MGDWNKYLRVIIQTAIFMGLFIQVSATEIWVSPSGSRLGDGTAEKPYATVDQALRKARELRRLHDPSIAQGIAIILKAGVYHLDETLFIRPEDSGTAQSPTVVRAQSGEHPILSGGRTIIGWKRAGTVNGLPKSAAGKVWVADAPTVAGNIVDFRQLWINGHKATRSKSHNGLAMGRILSWNHEEQTCWIPNPGDSSFKFTPGMEFFIHQWWAIAILRIKEAIVQADSMKLAFHQPESRIQSEHPWPAPWISAETGNSAFYLSNSIQFLDEPGEWYLDKVNRKIYYWPREDEDMNQAEVVYPYLETLVDIKGTPDFPVKNIHFEGISFQHSTWLRPSMHGHIPLQAGMYLLDAYKLETPGTADKATLENQAWVGRPASAVQVSYSSHTVFKDCRFEHLASTGLDYHYGNYADRIVGNVFKDIGGSGILIGKFSDEAFEAHLPYHPTDEREISSHITVEDNLITDVTNEDWGTVGIGAGFVREIHIRHNDISEVSYTGISLGWGWTPTVNAMKNNRISANRIQRYGKHLYDVAGIYTLSAQPGSIIAENSIDSIYKAPYAHLPDHWFYLYTDEGTAYFTIENNWYPSDKTLQNANGPGNMWRNNGSEVEETFRLNAGLTQAYKQLLRERVPTDARYEINIHVPFRKPVLVQVEAGDDRDINLTSLQQAAERQGIDNPEILQWKDRYVLVTSQELAKKFQGALTAIYPKARTTVFNDLFYEFNRSHCKGEAQTVPVSYIVLSANLVADEQKQAAYFDYHETQFEDWPEVSQGFCHANFQEVLLYRNGRQLMLIISIPAGEDFEALNPKTTESNPSMDEWNRIMGQYQEGITGTEDGEIWVFFK